MREPPACLGAASEGSGAATGEVRVHRGCLSTLVHRLKRAGAYFVDGALGVAAAGAEFGAATPASSATVALVGEAAAGVASPPQPRNNPERTVPNRSAYRMSRDAIQRTAACQAYKTRRSAYETRERVCRAPLLSSGDGLADFIDLRIEPGAPLRRLRTTPFARIDAVLDEAGSRCKADAAPPL
jgi:hypothetical protein